MSRTRDMTEGSIVKQIVLFSLPLMLGNIFQMLYNTVDVIVVGNFVGKEALAAVGSTTIITNMFVYFFNGFSVGAGVLISRFFGGKDRESLHNAVETTIGMTFVLCVLFTIAGRFLAQPMLRFTSTPDDVFGDASIYLSIYLAGISGLLIYNIGSGILRAVGDTTRPLLFLIFTSALNIILDLLFVLVFRMGIAGVAYATILSQMISAILILLLLTRTTEIYRFVWRDIRIDPEIMLSIFHIGLPMGIQMVLSSFSNLFVQAYINHFGSSVMAGWSCYVKLDQLNMLPVNSMAMAVTTFVGQNMGARNEERANRGVRITIMLNMLIAAVLGSFLFVFAKWGIGLFTKDESVIYYGVMFMRTNVYFMILNCVNHILSGALRGKGNSRAPMIIMLSCFVGMRQLYLYVFTRFVSNTPRVVGLGYPVGWATSCFVMTAYWFYTKKYGKKQNPRLDAGRS